MSTEPRQPVGQIFMPAPIRNNQIYDTPIAPLGLWGNFITDVLYTYRPAGANEEQCISVPRGFYMCTKNRLYTC